MKILGFVLVAVVLLVFEYLLGRLLFRCGFKKAGHYSVAVSGLHDRWLFDNCPYEYRNECKVWTCPAYSGQRETCKCCPVMDEE